MTPVLCPQALTPEQGAEQASSAAKRPRNGTTQTTLPFSQSGAPGRPAQRAEAAPAKKQKVRLQCGATCAGGADRFMEELLLLFALAPRKCTICFFWARA